MNNRNIFRLSTAAGLGFAMLSGGAFAQTKTLKQQLEGAYTLAKAFDTSADGKDNDVWGAGVQGSLMLDPSGRFSLFIVAGDRAKGEGTVMLVRPIRQDVGLKRRVANLSLGSAGAPRPAFVRTLRGPA